MVAFIPYLRLRPFEGRGSLLRDLAPNHCHFLRDLAPSCTLHSYLAPKFAAGGGGLETGASAAASVRPSDGGGG